MKKYILILLSIFSLAVCAEDHTIKMLNNGSGGLMVFEPASLVIKPGDTVHFKATDVMHNSESIEGMIPSGATPWAGQMSQDISVTLTEEGLYVYKCTPHMMMAMIGVIQVGAASNSQQIEALTGTLTAQFAMNKDRLTNYLSNLQK
jgi:pseudoazurin|tara:strand:- start:1588 stop:2028 length:441 start_codon:yes stop_codon:yes gene_type:complete